MKKYRNHGTIKEFKNGNINIKYDAELIAGAQRDELLTIDSLLRDIDCYFIGETYCLSNYETGHTVYNAYSDLIYIFPWRYLADLMEGRTVKLYARTPDDNDREILSGEGWE